jgi:hypothetical protein
MTAADGVVSVALGLGTTVVDGERALRFCPRYPRHLMDFSSPAEILANAQATFYALDLDEPGSHPDPTAELRLSRYGLDVAERDGTLQWVGSTYSSENDTVYDGLGRAGIPLVTFAPILKHRLFPLPEAVRLLLEVTSRGLNLPVEIEFAVNLERGWPSVQALRPAAESAQGPAYPGRGPLQGEFAFLQMRPLVVSRESERLTIQAFEPDRLLCSSRRILGNGRIDGIHDLVVVDPDLLDRSRSREAAVLLAEVNARLLGEGQPYVLLGPGRWGASEPWLGIPVTWDQISGARAIVEANMVGFRVSPSQGSHFFHNLTSAQVGYFTIQPDQPDSFVDWDWIRQLSPDFVSGAIKHIRLAEPVVVLMDQGQGRGVIVKGRRETDR